MKAPILSVVMIVKDEATTILATLESIKDCVDWVTVLDTGSTDGTQEIVRKAFETFNLPGKVYEHPFETFAASRNRCFDLNEEDPAPVFALVLDGGDILENGSVLREYCFALQDETHPAYYIQVRDNDTTYIQTRLSRVKDRWRYVGVVHEALMSPDRTQVDGPRLDGFAIIRPNKSVGADKRKTRFKRDLTLLRAELKANPNDTRTAFFIGQTHEGLEDYRSAIEAYRKRVSMESSSEEAWEAKYRIALCSTKLKTIRWTECQQMFLDAFAMGPHRAEPLYSIAVHYHEEGNHALAYLFALQAAEIPFPENQFGLVRKPIYDWVASDIVSIHAWFLGNYGIGIVHAIRALAGCPEEQKGRIKQNLEACYALNSDSKVAGPESRMESARLLDRALLEMDTASTEGSKST